MCLIVKQRNIQSFGTKKIDIACFRKVPKTTHFDAFFVSPNWVFWNDFSVELDITFLPYPSQWNVLFSREKCAICHKCDEDGDIRS